MRQEVAGFVARGDTPIALALEQAVADIPDGTLADIVLFSDGRDECWDADLNGDAAAGPSFGRDPCEVAREIGGQAHLKIQKIDTISFQAESAEEQLRCIAEETGGKSFPVNEPCCGRGAA